MAVGSALLGWLLLFGGLQFWFLVDHNLIRRGDLLAPEFCIVHKPVPLIGLPGGTGITFKEAEIADIKNQRFVQALAPFECSRFQAHASIVFRSWLSGLETDLFFESIPDDYLDVDLKDWAWTPGTDRVPIIMPREFLVLYNVGFARSQNLPQFDETLVRQVPFTVRLSGQGQNREFAGRIVGFSDRIPSVLVPQAFLRWANATLGEGQAPPSRLILKTDRTAGPELERFLKARKYLYNVERLRSSKLASLMLLLVYVVLGFGVLILGLALGVLALSFQLLIVQNRERLERLIRIGYDPGRLIWHYVPPVLGVLVLANVAGMAFLIWGTGQAIRLFSNYGYTMEPVSIRSCALAMALLAVLIGVWHSLALRRRLLRLA